MSTLLPVMILLPLATAVVVLLVRSAGAARWISLLGTLATLVLSLVLTAQFVQLRPLTASAVGPVQPRLEFRQTWMTFSWTDSPATLAAGGVIRSGFSAELDGVQLAARDAKSWIANLEKSERERTGIRSLKVGYNKVFGYYIEVTKSNQALVPADYIRKQTLVNAERYITPEMKEYETLVLNAGERVLALEGQLFEELVAMDEDRGGRGGGILIPLLHN